MENFFIYWRKSLANTIIVLTYWMLPPIFFPTVPLAAAVLLLAENNPQHITF